MIYEPRTTCGFKCPKPGCWHELEEFWWGLRRCPLCETVMVREPLASQRGYRFQPSSFVKMPNGKVAEVIDQPTWKQACCYELVVEGERKLADSGWLEAEADFVSDEPLLVSRK